ncbi:MAG TPA: phytanoyl-CoA dioxygenase family protein, partial [Acidimicrobiia bacterium]|nr:phytanoyl-CoA dioxygenase family protein [Acidimicrobiia bacterium]
DECTTESGCLWLAGGVDQPLPTDDRGVVRGDVVESLRWEPAELAAGDAVLLDGLAPHYSEANRGDRRRRVLVASYAPASEGYSRDSYYSARAETMRRASQQDGRFRISTLADFDGVEVDGGNARTDRCAHDPLEGGPAE